MGFVLLICLPVLLVLALVIAAAVLIKRRPWPAKKKKWVFAALSAYLAFPVLMPVGMVAAVPMPQFGFLMVALFSDGIGAPFGAVIWFLKTWAFTLPSFLITLGLLRLVANMIFFVQPAPVKAPLKTS